MEILADIDTALFLRGTQEITNAYEQVLTKTFGVLKSGKNQTKKPHYEY